LAAIGAAANLPTRGGDGRQARGGRRRTNTFVVLFAATAALLSPFPSLAADLPAGFVRLADIDPTIRQDMRYAGPVNFLGRAANGYEAPACILTKAAAEALAKVQKTLAAESLTLVVFDCYRPARAVQDFVRWVKQGGPPDPRWHPAVKRGRLIAEGYIGSRSAHSRGSTVDIAIAPLAPGIPASQACGTPDSQTLDFGTGFDCFDKASTTAFSPLPGNAKENRMKLVEAMRAGGFRNYRREWWHFTLEGEPFPAKRFDFPVTE
jgi:D-alanyl-D-alanine dipeptidase